MFVNHTEMKHHDLPITTMAEDRLHFKPFVERVAQGIKGYSQDDCFVISIEGEWGIGKTSFMNLVKSEIKNDVEIMHFNPWLITDIKQLVSIFFDELIKSISRISFKTKLKTDILKDLKRFASAVLPDQVSVGVTEGSKATWKLDKYFKPKDPEASQTLYALKEKINDYLLDAEKRIVVIVDDIDRLMDQEVELIFRLIKGIADFDNIIYILMFDREVVSASLAKYKAEKGSKYLDKIIQYPLTIPKPHHTTVINLLTEQLDSFLQALGSGNYHFAQEDWQKVHMQLGKYIKNVRDVNKLFDTFTYEYISINKDVNFVDFFVITLIRLHAYELYQFIKENSEYFTFGKAYTLLGFNDKKKEEIQQELIEKIRQKVPAFDDYYGLLQAIFPLFDEFDPRDIRGDHSRKSIADSFYFDHYFSMTVSDDKLSYDKHSGLVELLLEDLNQFVKKVQELSDFKVQQFFEMYRAHTSYSINDKQRIMIIENLVKSAARINNRDFRNDKTYCDFTWYSLSWIDLAAQEILKLQNPDEAFIIFEDASITVQHRCYLRHTLENLLKKSQNEKLCVDLAPYKEKHIDEIKKIDINKFLEFAFLNELIWCMKWLGVDISELRAAFAIEFFKDHHSFFKILEKFIYKYVSMPRAEYPYAISHSALKELVDIAMIQEYIDSIDTAKLSGDDQDLLNYWSNDKDL